VITKNELSEILHGVFGTSVGEGEDFLDKAGVFPKCAYFEISWNDEMASGESYEELVTYQISVEYRKPRDPALLALKKALNERSLHPDFYHEKVSPSKGPSHFHSYCSITCKEVLTDGISD
jgi:hypothetical protein